MNNRKKSLRQDLLFEALLSLETKEECQAFLEDICTIREVESMAQRIEVAQMLEASHTYLDIAAKTGASTATISRVNRALNYGSEGYSRVLKKIAEKKSTGDKI